MADTQNINAVTDLQSIDGNDSILVSDSNTSLGKINYNKLAKAIIESYTGSSLAGQSNVSIQQAFSTLNSKLVYTSLYSNDDLDSITTEGRYYIGATTPLHSPTGASTYTYMIVLARNEGLVLQLYISGNGQAVFMRRRSGNPAEWSSWYKYTGTIV